MKGAVFEKLIPGRISQADFDKIVALEANCGLPDPYPPKLIAELLSSLSCFVCRMKGEVVGFIMVNGNGRYFGGSVYIVNLNVDTVVRGQGIAKMLILTACRYYMKLRPGRLMSLDVTLTNPALKLYEKIGFRRTILPSRNGPEDIVMAAPMKIITDTIESLL